MDIEYKWMENKKILLLYLCVLKCNIEGNDKGIINERVVIMETAVRDDYMKILADEQKEVRNLVMAGLEQIKAGKTKDFNTVCDRLEKKYTDAVI